MVIMRRAKLMANFRKHKEGRTYWNYMGIIIVCLFGNVAYEEWAGHRIKIYGAHWK